MLNLCVYCTDCITTLLKQAMTPYLIYAGEVEDRGVLGVLVTSLYLCMQLMLTYPGQGKDLASIVEDSGLTVLSLATLQGKL